MKPTVGRKVWLYNPYGQFNLLREHNGEDGSPYDRHGYGMEWQPLDATIVGVFKDDLISVAGYDATGNPFSRVAVTLWDGAGEPPAGEHCRWMPFQIAQAKQQ